MTPRAQLVEVLLEARAALAHADNDFSRSSWRDADAALGEIDDFVSKLRQGVEIDLLELRVLFAATGPICEVSLSSGWSEGYLQVSERFDAAYEAYVANPA